MKYQRIVKFLNGGANYVKENESNKLTYAIKKVTGRLESIIEDYNELRADAEIDKASVDEKGNLIVINQTYVWTPAKRKELLAKFKTISKMEATKTFEPYFATELPKDLDEDWIEIFKGFVIPETEEPQTAPTPPTVPPNE